LRVEIEALRVELCDDVLSCFKKVSYWAAIFVTF
jgi:hypothetical protein